MSLPMLGMQKALDWILRTRKKHELGVKGWGLYHQLSGGWVGQPAQEESLPQFEDRLGYMRLSQRTKSHPLGSMRLPQRTTKRHPLGWRDDSWEHFLRTVVRFLAPTGQLTNVCTIGSRRPNVLLWPLWAPGPHMVHPHGTSRQAKHHTQKIIWSLKSFLKEMTSHWCFSFYLNHLPHK